MSAAQYGIHQLVARVDRDLDNIPGLNVMDVWGPVALGAMFACLLQGYVLAMSVGYFHQYANKDHWILRCTIVSDLRTAMCITLKYKQLLLLLTTAETGLVMTKSIKQTVIHPLDVFYVLDIAAHPDEWIHVLLANINIVICQTFLCWRCLRFARAMQSAYGRWVRPTTFALAGLMGLLTIGSTIGSVMLPLRLSQASSLLEALAASSSTGKLTFWFYYVFSIFVVMDVVIVLSTTIQHRAARTGFAESNTILNVIVNLTLRSGALILTCQLAQLILFHLSASSWVLFPHSFLSRIYAITVLSTLTLPRTAQSKLRQKQADAEEAMYPTTAAIRPHRSNSNSAGIRTGLSGDIPSQTSTRCVSCGGCSVGQYGSKGRASFGTPRLGYRGPGVGELGVMMHPRENGFAEAEGPVSFRAALFGLDEEGSEGKGSPEIGVGLVGLGVGMVNQGQDLKLEKWDEKREDRKAEGMESGTAVVGAVAIPILV